MTDKNKNKDVEDLLSSVFRDDNENKEQQTEEQKPATPKFGQKTPAKPLAKGFARPKPAAAIKTPQATDDSPEATTPKPQPIPQQPRNVHAQQTKSLVTKVLIAISGILLIINIILVGLVASMNTKINAIDRNVINVSKNMDNMDKGLAAIITDLKNDLHAIKQSPLLKAAGLK